MKKKLKTVRRPFRGKTGLAMEFATWPKLEWQFYAPDPDDTDPCPPYWSLDYGPFTLYAESDAKTKKWNACIYVIDAIVREHIPNLASAPEAKAKAMMLLANYIEDGRIKLVKDMKRRRY